MRTHMAISLAIAVAVAMAASSGCVSQDEYNKALTACRRSNEQLQKSQEALKLAESTKADAAGRLDQANAAIDAKRKEAILLQSQNSDLQASFDQLKALYEKATTSKAPERPGSILLPIPIDRAIRAFAKENPELIDYLPAYGMVKFKADLTFEKGRDSVSTGAADALAKLTEILNSAAAAKFHVYVAGHTDDIPIMKPGTRRRHPTNWYLSAHRAVEVQKVLEGAGLSPTRIGVVGFSQYHPIAPNEPGNKGNEKNRRVEIWIVPPGRFLTESVQAD